LPDLRAGYSVLGAKIYENLTDLGQNRYILSAQTSTAVSGSCFFGSNRAVAVILPTSGKTLWEQVCLCSDKTILTKGNIMAQAIMDPEKVRRFADELQRFNSELENRMSMLHARFAALGDTWSDQEHEKFAEEFRIAMKALKKFVELSRQHSPYLLRKAQRIEEYLSQR
jgi:uncharacterized protein YukE